MIQRNEVLTGEANRISLVSARRTATQEDYLTITEREIPVSMIEQSWIFDVGEQTRAGGTTPRLVNTLVKVMKWLNHLGSGRINDSCLESRHNIHDNPRIKGIGLW
jgi:hypothetical protein